MSHYDLDDVSNDLGSLLLNTEDINSQANAMAMIGKLDSAIDFMNDARSHFGATQNRLEMATENLQSMHENHSSSRSRIKDADFAAESAEMARVNVLQQAGISMLAQANQAPQQLMKLLQ
jgi:flagellin